MTNTVSKKAWFSKARQGQWALLDFFRSAKHINGSSCLLKAPRHHGTYQKIPGWTRASNHGKCMEMWERISMNFGILSFTKTGQLPHRPPEFTWHYLSLLQFDAASVNLTKRPPPSPKHPPNLSKRSPLMGQTSDSNSQHMGNTGGSQWRLVVFPSVYKVLPLDLSDSEKRKKFGEGHTDW